MQPANTTIGSIVQLTPPVRTYQLTTQIARLFNEQPKDNRPTWDEYFMQMAVHASTRATCVRAHVGCVLVRDNYPLVMGYNGSARMLPHCTDVGCLMDGGHCVRCEHAERNAVDQAAREGIAVKGCTCYVTHQPCTPCTNMLINIGCKRVVYLNEYAPADGGEFFRIAGVSVERIKLS